MAKRGLSDASAPIAAETPHYIGHRNRLRERFREGGEDALPDYELLELVLYAALRQGDVKPLAKRMLEAFNGDLAELFAADRERLKEIEGVGDAVVDQLKITRAAANRLLREKAKKADVTLSSWRALVDYCMAQMSREATE